MRKTLQISSRLFMEEQIYGSECLFFVATRHGPTTCLFSAQPLEAMAARIKESLDI